MFNRTWISLVILLGVSVWSNRFTVATLSKIDERSMLDSSTAVAAKHESLNEKLRKLYGT